MKRRKNLIIAFLLISSLVLSIGYAALNDTLVINGTADIKEEAAEEAFNDDIYFSDAVANQVGNVASVADGDPDMASFTASTLKGQGDKATFTFTIQNDGDLSADITPSIEAGSAGNSHPDYFAISSDWNGATKTLEAGEEITYTITIELLQTPTDTLTGEFRVKLDATAD